MTKRILALAMVLMLAFTTLIGCGGKEEVVEGEKVLKWNIGSEPKTLDPQQNSAADGGHVINNTFEGLMREVNGKVTPAVAESYEISEDGKTYTFKLRDAKWSDGQAITAGDFEYAWKRALDPNLIPQPSEYAFQLFYVKGAQDAYEGKGSLDDVAIKAIDDKTLEVELIAPTPYFLELTAFYTYMPVRKDMVEKDPAKWATNPETAVSNGPFTLSEYLLGDKIVLKKNENYWQADKVKMDKIEAFMIVDYSTNLAAYESGDIHANEGSVPPQEIPRLLEDKNSGFEIKPSIGTYYYIFNVTKAPFDNPKVRRALTLAIDRKQITENVSKGGELPATGFVPPGLLDAEGNEFRTVAGDYGIKETSDLEEAKKLLAEAGYPDGKGFPAAEVLYNTSEGHKAIGEAIQEMWRKNLGISVELRNQEWAVFQDTRHSGNFSIARAGWLGDYADPMTMLDLWLSYSGNNDAQWDSKEYDNLIEGSKLKTGQERFKMLYDAEKMMMDEMIVMPIYYYTKKVLVKPEVTGWEMTPLGHFFFGFADIQG
ncbi:MAG: peptide ABC transporter substrate-binding protein [Anaeromicrobium sp.]|jgi:oligopeptide transport system substrate-binding protein|uniref:peptide ABC transporter substrate-binding protein n=1 Tax=Anaeromicrobium sp. TaxID=1929132 RepID=UPI0025FC5014|nr:peptide ABC transporter substrate-binding protein [Anaeromicrobium sp.]MCT4593230.1 peptide ABC transporter substrate-binding protein [Anaeromicrobium sp.]